MNSRVLCLLCAPGVLLAASPFAGRWNMTVHDSPAPYPAWLELMEDGQTTRLRTVGRVGGAKPIRNFTIEGDRLTFSTQDWFGRYERVDYAIRVSERRLEGSVRRENGPAMRLEGAPAPSLQRAEPRWGAPVSLFNGKDLAGWIPLNPNSNRWEAVNGHLDNARRGSNLASERKLQDFKLHAEFMCAEKCNSGVFLRGRYEVQIELGSVPHSPDSATGSIYLYIAPSGDVPLPLGDWHTMDVILVGRTVTVALNGNTVIDRQEIPGPTGGALDSNEAEPGPIVLQGDHSAVSYRNIVVTPGVE